MATRRQKCSEEDCFMFTLNLTLPTSRTVLAKILETAKLTLWTKVAVNFSVCNGVIDNCATTKYLNAKELVGKNCRVLTQKFTGHVHAET